jgi:hypothetical protein
MGKTKALLRTATAITKAPVDPDALVLELDAWLKAERPLVNAMDERADKRAYDRRNNHWFRTIDRLINAKVVTPAGMAAQLRWVDFMIGDGTQAEPIEIRCLNRIRAHMENRARAQAADAELISRCNALTAEIERLNGGGVTQEEVDRAQPGNWRRYQKLLRTPAASCAGLAAQYRMLTVMMEGSMYNPIEDRFMDRLPAAIERLSA